MLPPYLLDDVRGLMPELKNLAVHDRRPDSSLSRSTSDERASNFRVLVGTTLDAGLIFNLKAVVGDHVEKYRFLNISELDAIENAAYLVEDRLINIVDKVHDTQKVIAYCKMLLRSTDPTVTRHRKLYKKQLKESGEEYKLHKRTSKRFYKDVADLWALLSEETKRTCDFEDAAAATAVPEPAANTSENTTE
ncbi:uncharacterized protein MELLADRAFT_91318 [Melampsora larici-populina 98AG31]|uniref:Uncharacterized protein n=1 Tax=Melampsora larici-populina (strain 98AG31 / pathotype 3-4-7) TaxID=747676 RepID=F4RYM2_MELLP|nr:uncharacterized protein MELLADRAFT_91318 [Melampsora larici-populina 98AG31]EGG02552.1 hypothetical protein MELLADRAFT_91318 [Melampsora larici-populina 98AG31]